MNGTLWIIWWLSGLVLALWVTPRHERFGCLIGLVIVSSFLGPVTPLCILAVRKP